MDASGLERLHQAMAARVAGGEMPGIVTLVARGDQVHVDAIGRMAFDGEPMRRDTIFRIASMTKPVLGAATLMLVEEGRLSLEEPVDRLLPELADRRVLRRVDGPLDDTVPARRPITVEDLLTFRLGFGMLTEPTFNPPFPIVAAGEELQLVLNEPHPRTPHDPDEWIARFATLPLMYQPGERWLYNAGSLVLGVLVARAAGQQLGDVLRTRLFEPLGMSDTGFSMSAERVGRLPSAYATDFETGKATLNTMTGPDVWTAPPRFPSGAGGLLSTADDFLTLARMLLGKGAYRGRRLLTERSVEAMTMNQLTPEQVAGGGIILGGNGWGYGVGVRESGRYGWAGHYGTTWFNDPHLGLTGIALTQVPGFLGLGGLTEFEELAEQV